MRQGELAEVIGVKQSTLTNYERGSRKIPLEHVVAISDYFSVSIDGIVRGGRQSMTAIALWEREIGSEEFSEDEMWQIVDFAKYIIYKRREHE